MSQQLMVLGLFLIGIIVLFALMMSRALSRPIVGLTDVAEKMAAGQLDQKIALGGQDELGRLAKSFAAMRDAIGLKIVEVERQNQALKTLDKAKDDLLANTSHELRTPIAIVRTSLENLSMQFSALNNPNTTNGQGSNNQS
ncbi:MAG: HAMP domain-containing protein, partial [Psychrosphaera sp.]|nr:HAMP domain-containing protein [Psychrosphaera sp.]